MRRIDPVHALRLAALWSLVGFAIWMVAVTVLYAVLAALGVIGTVNDLFGQLGTSPGHHGSGLISITGVYAVTASVGLVVALLGIVVTALSVA